MTGVGRTEPRRPSGIGRMTTSTSSQRPSQARLHALVMLVLDPLAGIGLIARVFAIDSSQDCSRVNSSQCNCFDQSIAIVCLLGVVHATARALELRWQDELLTHKS